MAGRVDGDELERVERFAQRRWLVVLLFTLAFAFHGLSWALRLAEAPAVAAAGGAAGARVAGAGLAWALWGCSVLMVTFGPGGLRWSARQRRVLNDELVAADRRAAAGAGYWVLLAGLAALCGAMVAGAAAPSLLLRAGAPALLTLGVAAPALVFSVRQRRAAEA